jgi:A/G-specific adenine glycosylase
VVPPRRTLLRVRRELLAWYERERRDFPWRRTHDPYAVLVSEMMLQQTQAGRVAERFPRFMARFPTVEALAAAPPAAVLAEWSGLGYNRRALALQSAAREIAGGGWSREVPELERLTGVGPYTARALASLAFGVPVGVVDTNVRRWLVRRFPAVAGAPGTEAHELQVLADALAAGIRPDADEAARWTHATMELGAAVCQARAPRCGACPIARGCPSRSRARAVPVPRQSAFAGSSRELRGAILRALSAAPEHRIERGAALALAADPARTAAALAALEREGLIHLRGDRMHLGPAEADRSADTIGR